MILAYLYRSGQHKRKSSQCAVLVTPDGERSFAYMDGASWDLSPSDLDMDALKSCRMIVNEIYMFGFGAGSDLPRAVVESVQQTKHRTS